MRFALFLILLISFFSMKIFSQIELTTGYAVNRLDADGIPIQVAYDFKLKNRLYTKLQIGYKYLYRFNDFIEATAKCSIFEFHQTFSYEAIKKRKYILKPNIGVNFRFYSVEAKMLPPYNTRPQRAWIMGYPRNRRNVRLNSYDGDGTMVDNYKVNNLGFSFQLQNQFRLTNKLWFHVTPFVEPDYDKIQNTGGCYVGIIFKQL